MLTKIAVKEYEICRKWNKFIALPADAEQSLAWANAYEDLAFIGKALNWHFYHPTKDLGPGTLGFGRGSLQWRFEELENELQQSHSLGVLGGLLHYVQDVTNPAHVAPVYHDFNDSFDNYDFRNALPDVISESECRDIASIKSLGQSYFQVLTAMSWATLRRMTETFQFMERGTSHSITWEDAFWNPEYGEGSKQNGFGRYGRFGNEFGTVKISGVTINATIYAEFAKRQIRDALNASIVFMQIYQSSSQN